jgi:hypothetical protein
MMMQRLGYRTVQDRTRARERGIRAPHFGELDATLEKRADAERVISFEDAVPPQPAAQTLRLQLIGRLKYLEEYGLALPTGGRTWYLHELHRPLLRQMQLLRDVQKSVARGEVLLANPDSPQMLRELGPGELVRGRVAGVTFGEVEERVFLALEGTGGYVYLIRRLEIEQRRREGGLRGGRSSRSNGARPSARAVSTDRGSCPRPARQLGPSPSTTVLTWRCWNAWRASLCGTPRVRPGIRERWETASLSVSALIRAGLVLEPAARPRRQAAQGLGASA